MFLFDLDGTLYPYERPYVKLIEKHWKAIGIGISKEYGIDLYEDFKYLINELKIGDETDRYQISKTLEILGFPYRKDIFSQIVKTYGKLTTNLRLLSPLITLIHELKKRKKNLYIITASLRDIAIRKLEILGIAKYFDLSKSVFGDNFHTKQQQMKYLLDKFKTVRKVIYFEDSRRVLKRNIKLFEESELEYIAILMKPKKLVKIKELIEF